MSNFKKKKWLCLTSLGFLLSLSLSCGDDKEGGSMGQPYNPDKPIQITEFYPDSGGIATKVIIKGENFGTDPEKVHVYFNEKRAAVVQAIGNMIYAIVPKQPGDTCFVSVAIGKDSLIFDNTFEYTTTTTVSTIAGKVGVSAATDGTLAEAEFHSPRYLVVDAEKNIFVSEFNAHMLRQINEASNIVTTIHKENGMANPNAPATDAEKKVILVPNDGGNVFMEFDPEIQWAGKKISPRPAEGESFTINYKHSLAPNPKDGMVYTRAHNGQLIKFDPRTKAAYLVAIDLMPDSDSYLYFHPNDPNLLFICYAAKHCIYTFNLETKEHTLFAGSINKAGWMDGERLYAEFSSPRQICFDKDANLYVADGGNHCIRKIDPKGIVSTVVGIPQVSGYRDGTPDEAMFNQPDGVAIDDEGILYVADYGNKIIRKLAIE